MGFFSLLQCKFLCLNNSKSSGIQEGARTYYGPSSRIDVKRYFLIGPLLELANFVFCNLMVFKLTV